MNENLQVIKFKKINWDIIMWRTNYKFKKSVIIEKFGKIYEISDSLVNYYLKKFKAV